MFQINQVISGDQETCQRPDDHRTDFCDLLGIGHAWDGFVESGSFPEPA